jgi:hypothetical protein
MKKDFDSHSSGSAARTGGGKPLPSFRARDGYGQVAKAPVSRVVAKVLSSLLR